MATRTINLGSGRQVYHADALRDSGDHLILNMGNGGDTAITGGGGLRVRPEGFIYRVRANTGLDKAHTVEIDHYYTESLPDPQNHYVGGHVLMSGRDVYAEFHDVAFGPGDHVRISLFDQRHYLDTGNLRMMTGHVPGLAEAHGPGVAGYASKLKAFDSDPDGQQLAWAAEGMHQTRIEAIEGPVTREADGDGFRFFVTKFQARAVTDDILTNGQRVQFQDMDMLRGESREDYVLHLDANTYEDKREAVADMFEAWSERSDPAVLWAI